jgi:hypothetical protein
VTYRPTCHATGMSTCRGVATEEKRMREAAVDMQPCLMAVFQHGYICDYIDSN